MTNPLFSVDSYLATTEEIFNQVWGACTSLFKSGNPAAYKEHILTLFFLKYLSDAWDERHRFYTTKYAAYPERALRIQRSLRNERFQIPPQSHYEYLYERRDQPTIGIILNQALQSLETANWSKLDNAFRGVDFAVEIQSEPVAALNKRLKTLLEAFNQFSLASDHVANPLVAGEVYELLLERFAVHSGKHFGEVYTPTAISTLLARLVEPLPGDRICDPACGSASLLIRTGQQVPGGGSFVLYGQELNAATTALARQNCVLHLQDDAVLAQGNTLTNPLLTESGHLLRFNVVVTDPPFSLSDWGHEWAANDPFQRFRRGIPPRHKGDFAFISHLVETMTETDGRGAVVVPHGVLFRGGEESKIRQRLLEEGLIEAVIGLPANLFFGTNLPTVVLLLRRRSATDTDVLVVDASTLAADTRPRATLLPVHLDHVVALVQAFRRAGTASSAGVLEPQIAYRATLAEIARQDYSLAIPRYVATAPVAPIYDLPAIQAELTTLETQLLTVRSQMQVCLAALGTPQMQTAQIKAAEQPFTRF